MPRPELLNQQLRLLRERFGDVRLIERDGRQLVEIAGLMQVTVQEALSLPALPPAYEASLAQIA